MAEQSAKRLAYVSMNGCSMQEVFWKAARSSRQGRWKKLMVRLDTQCS